MQCMQLIWLWIFCMNHSTLVEGFLGHLLSIHKMNVNSILNTDWNDNRIEFKWFANWTKTSHSIKSKWNDFINENTFFPNFVIKIWQLYLKITYNRHRQQEPQWNQEPLDRQVQVCYHLSTYSSIYMDNNSKSIWCHNFSKVSRTPPVTNTNFPFYILFIHFYGYLYLFFSTSSNNIILTLPVLSLIFLFKQMILVPFVLETRFMRQEFFH